MKWIRDRFHHQVANLPYANFVKQVSEYSFLDQSDDFLRSSIGTSPELAKRYALLREIIRRKTGLTLFDNQLATAYALEQGHIAELPTGEGKTLSAVCAAISRALEGHRVHVLVFNDYLALRDAVANRPIYEFCGLRVGYITQNTPPQERKEAYDCDVTYLAAKEAGFDYLRDFLCCDPSDLIFPAFDTAIVDEADSILIDEARVPLVLAGNLGDELNRAAEIDLAVASLSSEDVSFHQTKNQAWLTDDGIAHMENFLQIEDLYAKQNTELLALIDACLQARFILQKDKDYIIKQEQVLVVDESTGRVAKGRKFPDLLQHAVEIKENLDPAARTTVLNSTPIQSFLRQYPFLCGMTGTAASASSELWNMYELDVDVIPPHTPCIRIDCPDEILPDLASQQRRVVEEIIQAHEKGQPVLLGTGSVSESEAFGELLQKEGLSCCILNARNDEAEANAVAHAGELGRITVSTNLSGRGVDIRLGGGDPEQAELVRKIGGLYVIGTAFNASVRIDNQLRGRAGRQGDPGKSQYFIRLDHPFLQEYYDQEEQQKLTSLAQMETQPAQRALRRAVREAQKNQEAQDAESRYMLSRYAAILERNREIVSSYRMEILTRKREPDLLQAENPEAFQKLCERVGGGATIAQRQLILYYINLHWANYLSAMESVRDSIHFVIMGRKNPLEEYQNTACNLFEEMMADIKNDVLGGMDTLTITENGIDMEKEGLCGATTTLTYQIDESRKQFSRLAAASETVSHTIHAVSFSAARRKSSKSKH